MSTALLSALVHLAEKTILFVTAPITGKKPNPTNVHALAVEK